MSADDAAPRDYEDLKALGESLGVPVGNLYPLSFNNDPYVAGVGSREEAARWIAAIWTRLGIQPGVHVRRIHYKLVSQSEAVPMPSGEFYKNSEKCWQLLNTALRDARYLDLIPVGDLIDRRTPNR